MLGGVLNLLWIFAKTFFYLMYSFVPGTNIQDLKQRWARGILKSLGYQVEILGTPPKANPIILVGNHVSFLDPVMLIATYPNVAFLAKRAVLYWPVIGAAAARIGCLFVTRESKEDRAAAKLKVADKLIGHHANMGVFPSGTTTIGETPPWRKGVFEIAAAGKIPVKAFALNYYPLKEAAYLDGNILIQFSELFTVKNKKATITWLKEYQVIDPVASAAEIQKDVMGKLDLQGNQ